MSEALTVAELLAAAVDGQSEAGLRVDAGAVATSDGGVSLLVVVTNLDLDGDGNAVQQFYRFVGTEVLPDLTRIGPGPYAADTGASYAADTGARTQGGPDPID